MVPVLCECLLHDVELQDIFVRMKIFEGTHLPSSNMDSDSGAECDPSPLPSPSSKHPTITLLNGHAEGVTMTRENGQTRTILDDMVGVGDCVLLDPLTEDAFVDNLQKRFASDDVYTYIGSVVVSVNPYRKLPIYSVDKIHEYRGMNLYELPPHIYAITDDAYRALRDKNRDQCIIISGESGSGKTEASKIVMQYVAEVCGKGKEVDKVKEQLLQSNPVLEAFGNAKTNRNDNSSRFGKYMDIEFDFKGEPIGGVITKYLLEKSRVVNQASGERNFHIFYQLLAGAPELLLGELDLVRETTVYQFLRGEPKVSTINDRDCFGITQKAMQVIGFSDENILSIYKLLACILKLGNIQFKAFNTMNGVEGVRILNQEDLDTACGLLECERNNITDALTKRTMLGGKGDKVTTSLSESQAYYAKDALSKAIYDKLFTWIVNTTNQRIQVQGYTSKKVMGVLDIYGFEIFNTNGFEQFIINYCNEKLQQIFIELTLREEQEEYIREGIEWTHIEYFDNISICDLIEKPNAGILAMLDEECLRPGDVSDETFLNKLNAIRYIKEHEHFETRKKLKSDKTISHQSFRLQHYAGAVTYEIEGFIDKNNDLLFRDLSQLMYNCDHPLMKDLFPEGNPSLSSKKRPPTTCTQFKLSVSSLMKNLLSKDPSYIRCIKPNENKAAKEFDTALVRHQVRYLGLMENVRVKRAGYAFRQQYETFLKRYKMLCPKTWPNWKGQAKDGVKQITATLRLPKDECAFGTTKIFIRTPRTLFDLEERRKRRMEDLAVLIQRIYRGWKCYARYKQMRSSAIIIESHFRGYREKKRYQTMRHASTTITSYWKGHLARVEFRKMKYRAACIWAAAIIHKYYIGWKARVEFRKIKYIAKRKWAAAIIHKYYVGWKVRKEHRKHFRANATPKLINFITRYVHTKYLQRLQNQLPTMSPTDQAWPPCAKMHAETHKQLKIIFQKWRANRFRKKFDEQTRMRLGEKVTASILFKDKKKIYPNSVPKLFQGDYVRLRMNDKYKKLFGQSEDKYVVFADVVSKINRGNGKFQQQLFVLSTSAFLMMDQKTLAVKNRLPLKEVTGFTVSPYSDYLIVIHIAKGGGDHNKKGDYIIVTEKLVELVTKFHRSIRTATNHDVKVKVADRFGVDFDGTHVQATVCTQNASEPNPNPTFKRKGAKLDIMA